MQLLHWWSTLLFALAIPQFAFGEQILLGSPTDPVIPACPPLPPRKSASTSVHDLRIDDIKVIAALGDSITAGFAAKGLSNGSEPMPMRSTTENRGTSFSMGGDTGVVSVPNLIRQFQPELKGYSTGDHIAEICYGLWCVPFQYWPRQDKLNAAQTGAMVHNLIYELQYLVSAMKMQKDIDFEKDFKLLTLFIGSNDVCLGCSSIPGPAWPSPALFEQTVRILIGEIRARIPRVVVNVLMQFNVSQVYDLTHDDPWCARLRASGFVFECSCAFLPGAAGPLTRRLMDELVQSYNSRLQSIRDDYKTRRYDDFAMMVDPGFSQLEIRNWPLGHVSDVDCFHPGVKAHEAMAVGVWNNLFLPEKKKHRSIDPNKPLDVFCPGADSRIRTD
ncbi:hypothetical protein HK097_011007 [Rhizophlyctis rosea]|uniref:Phospholipase B1, membrane-associated n=1 Tax=Rhizophlyctis rosea TaxID=64517 RepID=A0AAD5X4W5_9FUNG|nr:hypothetical protein HK097_011007 [Rhizophlyctis rosea]